MVGILVCIKNLVISSVIVIYFTFLIVKLATLWFSIEAFKEVPMVQVVHLAISVEVHRSKNGMQVRIINDTIRDYLKVHVKVLENFYSLIVVITSVVNVSVIVGTEGNSVEKEVVCGLLQTKHGR